jgi:hypothetical protein
MQILIADRQPNTVDDRANCRVSLSTGIDIRFGVPRSDIVGFRVNERPFNVHS